MAASSVACRCRCRSWSHRLSNKLALSRGTQRIEDQGADLGRSLGRASHRCDKWCPGAEHPARSPADRRLARAPRRRAPRLLQAVEKACSSHRLSPLSRDFALQLSGTPQICAAWAKRAVRSIWRAKLMRARCSTSACGRIQLGLSCAWACWTWTSAKKPAPTSRHVRAAHQSSSQAPWWPWSAAYTRAVRAHPRHTAGEERGAQRCGDLARRKTVGRTPHQHVVFTGRHQLTLKRTPTSRGA